MNTQKEILSVHEIWKSKKIYWVKTYKTLLKYVSKDYKDILLPIVKGSKSGKRYFISKENLDEFVQRFENNKLSD
jgi:hypothetical protein